MEVAVSALRAELKTWIEKVGAGDEVVITDRGVPVARLTGIDGGDLVADLQRAGVLIAPQHERDASAGTSAVASPAGPAPAEDEHRGGVTGLVRRLRR